MTTVYIIRHAEAEGNLYRRVQGHFDGKITARGKQQISALAERFKHTHIDAVYASDLSRTQETAGAITKYQDLPINIEPRLREVGMGIWENMTWGDVELYWPEQLYNFSSDPDNWHVEGNESFKDLENRMLEAVSELAKKHDGQTIALFSHGMAIRALHCRVLGVPSRDVSSIPHGDNTSVSLYTWDNGVLTPEYRNDNSHLDKATSTFAHQTWWKKVSGKDKNNLRFAPLDIKIESEYYAQCYADAWNTVHGTLDGFDQNAYIMNAKLHACEEGCLVKVISGDEPIGVVEMDMHRGQDEGYAWISLCYLNDKYRGVGYGAQLIGHAVTIAHQNGMDRLRLHVADCNENAYGFYRHFEFRQIDENMGVLGVLRMMEKVLP